MVLLIRIRDVHGAGMGKPSPSPFLSPISFLIPVKVFIYFCKNQGEEFAGLGSPSNFFSFIKKIVKKSNKS